MANLNDGVGKKIVEALKKQSEIESGAMATSSVDTVNSLGVDVGALDDIANNGLLSSNLSDDSEQSLGDLFDAGFEPQDSVDETFNDFMNREEKPAESADMPGNIVILKKLITQLPSGVTRHTGAQIIRQTMEALGISMKSVLQDAQQVQENLKVSARECQASIQEYKKQILTLEKQSQSYQKQYSALNDLISLFIQTTK